MASSGMSVLWFLLIVALIPVTLWMLKRSGLAHGNVGAQALFKPLGQFSLGPGQRLVAVEVGSGEGASWLILSVTAQRVSLVHRMPPQEITQAAAPQTPNVHPAFHAVLRRFADAQQGKGAK